MDKTHKFNKLLDIIPDMVCIASTDGYFKYLNPEWEKTLGYSLQELLSRPFFEFIHPDDLEPTKREIERQLNGGGTLGFKNRYRCKDGSYKVLEWRATSSDQNTLFAVARDNSERRQVEESLKLSEKRHRNVLETLQLIAVSLDTKGEIEFCNDHLLDLTGWKREEVIGNNWFTTFLPAEIRGEIKQSVFLKTIQTDNFPTHYQNEIITKKGERRVIKWNNIVTHDSEGNIIGITSIGEDITERKNAEKAIIKERDFISKVFYWIDSLVVVVDLEGYIVSFNRASEQLSGYRFEEVQDRPFWDIFLSPDESEGVKATIKDVLNKGLPKDAHNRWVTKSGQERLIHWHNSILKKADGSIEYILCTGLDITERHKVETALKESEEKFRNMAENSLVGVYIIEDNVFTYVNPKFAEIFGYSEEEYLNNMPVRQFVHPEDMAFVQEQVRLRESGELEFTHYTFKGIKKNGEIIHAESFGSSILLNGKNAVTGMILDITERKQLERQLRQSQKLESIGTLAGGIAHDFNNILASIIGFTELALDDVAKGTPIEDQLQEVYTAGKRARDLVKQILTFAHQSDDEHRLIHVGAIIKEVLKLIRSTIPTTIEIRENIKSKSHIMGNPSQVHQVFMNLFTNAAQAMDHTGGILEIGVTDVKLGRKLARPLSELKSGNYMKVTVSDTGSGIPPNVIHSIFDPYFTTKDVGEGTGMGLALVHGVVESYGGKIIVDSKLGKGTLFSIYLPIAKMHGDIGVYVEEKLPSGTERILFVDDELPIVKMSSQILERLGYRVTERTSSVEALKLFKLKPNDFDLIITDMTMPSMTGEQLTIELMKIRLDIPVILCTGYSKKITDETASEIGIKAFAYKPIVKADLAKTVRKVLDEAKGTTQQ